MYIISQIWAKSFYCCYYYYYCFPFISYRLLLCIWPVESPDQEKMMTLENYRKQLNDPQTW